MNNPKSLAKESRKKWLIVAVVIIVAAAVTGGLLAYNKWRATQPITFEGKVTKHIGGLNPDGCYIDDSCSVVVAGKTVLVDCGFGPGGDECPVKHLPQFRVGGDAFAEEPPIGWRLRITAQKDKDDNDYNLHCDKCGLTVLR
jgi:hypothetical protein